MLVIMSTATIYVRVPGELKEAASEYASSRGMSLASAVTDLMGRGLEAAENEPSLRALEARAQEVEQARSAAQAMSERLKPVLGRCGCGTDLTGRDLLITGHCPKCNRSVVGLLAAAGSTDAGSVNRGEVAPFIAGVGVALAVILIAYAATK
jgi:antitoxin component of RelBE/YafQ-DinJ toxin-antitoxin module